MKKPTGSSRPSSARQPIATIATIATIRDRALDQVRGGTRIDAPATSASDDWQAPVV